MKESKQAWEEESDKGIAYSRLKSLWIIKLKLSISIFILNDLDKIYLDPITFKTSETLFKNMEYYLTCVSMYSCTMYYLFWSIEVDMS